MTKYEGPMIKATNALSVGGITVPAWWPSLDQASNVAVKLVPILSAMWLLMQMFNFVMKHWRAFHEDESGAVSKWGAGGMIAAVMALAVPTVAKWEGMRTEAYRDVVGVWTICSGETNGVKPGDSYTVEQCEAMLESRVLEFYEGFKDCAPKIAQAPVEVQAAVSSWSYNVGLGAACRSTLARYVRAGEWREACEQLPRWNRAGGRVWQGLVNRRADERGLCLSGLS